jgi:hypothetical protein
MMRRYDVLTRVVSHDRDAARNTPIEVLGFISATVHTDGDMRIPRQRVHPAQPDHIAVGFGSTKPVADDSNAEGKAKNQRIVVAPAALRGILIGGMPADGNGKPAGNVCK